MAEPGNADNDRRADADEERNPKNKDKPEAVEKNDADESVHLSDEDQKTSADTPLIESVSEDVSAEVGEFMEQAAQQNEAAAEAVAGCQKQARPLYLV